MGSAQRSRPSGRTDRTAGTVAGPRLKRSNRSSSAQLDGRPFDDCVRVDDRCQFVVMAEGSLKRIHRTRIVGVYAIVQLSQVIAQQVELVGEAFAFLR